MIDVCVWRRVVWLIVCVCGAGSSGGIRSVIDGMVTATMSHTYDVDGDTSGDTGLSGVCVLLDCGSPDCSSLID